MLQKRKAIICSTSAYPHGSPAAQRLHYLAKILQLIGYLPIVISNGKNIPEEFDASRNLYVHSGVVYVNVRQKKRYPISKLENIDRLVTFGDDVIRKISEFGLDSGDILLIYTLVPFFVQKLLKYSRKVEGVRVINDRTEWHQPNQFRFGKYDPFYLMFKEYFEKVLPKSDLMLVVSRTLEAHFCEAGKPVLRIPIVTDAENYPCPDRTFNGKLHYIYPGVPGNKDDFGSMLRGFVALSEAERARVRFHLTSVKRAQVAAMIGEEGASSLDSLIEYHGWMEYADLLKLYGRAQFLLIAKPNNIVSHANFPSKVPELIWCSTSCCFTGTA